MQTGHGSPPPVAFVEPPVPAPRGAGTGAGLPMPAPGPDGLCADAARFADTIVPDQSLIWLLETAVAQLHQVVAELGQVGNGTRQVAERVHALAAIDWESPAGKAFAERSQRLRVRAEQLAATAEEQSALGRSAIDDLQQRIGRLRADLAVAQSIVQNALTLGTC